MIEFAIDLIENYQRPVIRINKINTLIDTGAIVPVFSISAGMVELAFNAKLIQDNVHITGFGGECSGKVYEMAEFKVGRLTYKPFQFFVPDEIATRTPILLPATMFYGTDYEFDTINGKFTIRVEDEQKLTQSFLLKDLQGKLYAQIGDVLIQDDGFGQLQEFDSYLQLIISENTLANSNQDKEPSHPVIEDEDLEH